MSDTKDYIKGDKHMHQARSVMIKFADSEENKQRHRLTYAKGMTVSNYLDVQSFGYKIVDGGPQFA